MWFCVSMAGEGIWLCIRIKHIHNAPRSLLVPAKVGEFEKKEIINK